ncbi:MAG: hypothetical protein WC222_01360 [Parachlamydiales bacterium]|jgi:hypothetical protein
MFSQDNYAHAKFGIDEIYVHDGFTYDLLEKLHQRSVYCLDAEDKIVQKYTSHDMVLVFNNRVPSQSLIYRFLEALDKDVAKDIFIKSNTLLNEEELFPTIRSKQFVLVTHRILLKETYSPTL